MPETMEGTTRPSKRFHAAAHLFACAAVAHTLGGPPRGEAKFKVHSLARWSDLYPGVRNAFLCMNRMQALLYLL